MASMMSISNPVSMIFDKDAFGNITLNGKVIEKRNRKHERKFMSAASAQKLGEKFKALEPTERFLIEERAKNHRYLHGKKELGYESFEQYATRCILEF